MSKVHGVRSRSGRSYRGALAMVAALALLLAACGDDGGTTDDPAPGTTDDGDGAGDGDGTDDGDGDGDGDAAGGDIEQDAAITIDALSEPDSLDPLYRNAPEHQRIYRLTHNGLLRWEEDQTLSPDLAASMPEVSDDRLTYTIELRDDVTFHDGTPMTAEDVVFTYQTSANPENGSVWLSALAFMESIEAPDDTTVVITLNQPYTYFEGRLAMIPIVSSELGYETNTTYASESNGTGPFQLTGFDPGETITLSRFDDYHGDAPTIQTVTFALVQESATRVARLANDETTIVTEVPGDQIDLVNDRGANAQVVEGNVSRVFLYPSQAEGRPTTDADFRLAIAWAIDRGAIVDQVYNGAARPNSTYLSFGSQYHDEELGLTFGDEPDLDRAQEHLDASGVSVDEPLELIVLNIPDLVNMGTIIQANLGALGFEVNIEALEIAAFFPRLIEGSYDLLAFRSPVSTAVGFAPDYPFAGLYSQSASNFNRFNDPQMDELLLAAITAPEEDAEDAWRAVSEYDVETQGQIQVVAAQYSEGWSDRLVDYEPSSLVWFNNLPGASVRAE